MECLLSAHFLAGFFLMDMRACTRIDVEELGLQMFIRLTAFCIKRQSNRVAGTFIDFWKQRAASGKP
jgi:hypothetical protein